MVQPSKTPQRAVLAHGRRNALGHPYRIREIAEQAGLSVATVDRVLNGRPGVRLRTVAAVNQAIADLDRQRSQLRLAGRTFLVDLVMQAPQRFSSAVRRALEAELPALRPAVVRSRFHLGEEGDAGAVVRILEKIGCAGGRNEGVVAPIRASRVPKSVSR
jgi:LacI family transcriptional regulator